MPQFALLFPSMEGIFSDKRYSTPLVVILLSLVGLVFAVLALHDHASVQFAAENGLEARPTLCSAVSLAGTNFDCKTVATSRWATVAGVPLASFAVAFYLFLLLAALLARAEQTMGRRESSDVFFAMGAAGAFISVVLFVVSKVEIKAFCLFCVGMYLVNFLLFVVGLFAARAWGSGLIGLLRGALLIITAPLRLVTSNQYGVASLSALAALLILWVSYSLPEFIILRVVQPEYIAAAEQGEEVNLDKLLETWEKQTSSDLALTLDESAQRDHVKGPATAPVTIVEFSDFECPACQLFYLALEELISLYPDKIRLVYRNYPLDQACNPSIDRPFHQHACLAAKLARCAGEQGKFWEMSDYLFQLGIERSQSDEQTLPDLATAMHAGVAKLELDKVKIDGCVVGKEVHAKLLADIQAGDRLGVQGTPSIWVNGKQVSEPSPALLKAIVDKILGSAAPAT